MDNPAVKKLNSAAYNAYQRLMDKNVSDYNKALAEAAKKTQDAAIKQAENAKGLTDLTSSIDRTKATYDRMGGGAQSDIAQNLANTIQDVNDSAQNALAAMNALAASGAKVNIPQLTASIQTAQAAGITGANRVAGQQTAGLALNNLSDTMNTISARRNDFLGGVKNGEDLKKYIADITTLEAAIEAVTGLSEEGTKQQSDMWSHVSEEVAKANKELQQMPKWLKDIQSAVSGAFGSAVTRSLDNFWQKNRQGSRVGNLWNNVQHDFRETGRQTIGAGIGNLAKQGMSGLIGGAFNLFGGHKAAALKPLGTKGNPMYVTMDQKSPGGANGSAGAIGAAGGLLGGLLGGQKKKSGGLFGGLASALSFVPGLGGYASMLTGAGFASGGQMNMRRWNLVGEHGPELVAPGGFVVPMGGRHGFNAHSGGGGTHIVINHHGDVNGVQQHEEMMADWSNQIMRRLSVSTTMTGVPALGY
jgi:hypothetical protein